MVRVVLDTNVVISGLLFGGTPALLLELAFEEDVRLILSPPLVTELEEVLRTKLPHAAQTVWETVAALKDAAIEVNPTEHLAVVPHDPDGNRILECAVAGNADAIVSGDTHLLALRTFRRIPILTPQAFLATFPPTG